jgi:hypothetical protein
MGFAVLSSYGSVGGACSVIDRQIKVDKKLRRRIEQIREMASSASIQKETVSRKSTFTVPIDY